MALVESSIANEVRDSLKAFHPAVMAFPWAVALNRTASMRTVRDAYVSDTAPVDNTRPDEGHVYPLTGFDNGNVLFHHSLMPFILPFAPQHEEGLHGEWTLPATWLQLRPSKAATALGGFLTAALPPLPHPRACSPGTSRPAPHPAIPVKIT